MRVLSRCLWALPVVALATTAACASVKDKDRFRTLDAVVAERIFEPPGGAGSSFRGSGEYYLVFEARDGEATARYRFPVTQNQYFRFPEGTRVQLVVAGDRLRDIRPVAGP